MARIEKGTTLKQTRPDFSEMAKKWPSSHVERSRVGEFTGGIIAPGTMANLDSKGQGVPGATHVGRRVVYPCMGIVKWLEDRAERTVVRRVGLVTEEEASK